MSPAEPFRLPRLFTFVGADRTLIGDALPLATRLQVVQCTGPSPRAAAAWALTQDERRAVFEAQSHHIAIGMRYLPAVARRLHHCRDLGPDEPFDILTWFDDAPEHETAFDNLFVALRDSREWAFVDREVDIRLVRESA